MKKTVCFILCVIFLVSLFGCKNTESDRPLIVTGTLENEVTALCESGGEWIDINDTEPLGGDFTWEPGSFTARVIKIANVGSLDFKWTVNAPRADGFGEVADVIDVYVKVGGSLFPTTAEELESWTCLGNLSNVYDFGSGVLEANEEDYIAIAMKMREDASNLYCGKKLEAPIDFEILITQNSPEGDEY